MMDIIRCVQTYKKIKPINTQRLSFTFNKDKINLKNTVDKNSKNMDIDNDDVSQTSRTKNQNQNQPSKTSILMKSNPVDKLGFSLYPTKLDKKTIDYTKWLTETMKQSNLPSFKLVLVCMIDDWYIRYNMHPLYDKEQKNKQALKLMGFVYPYIRYVIKACEHDVQYYDIFVKYMINLHYYIMNQLKYNFLNITSELAAGIAFNVCVTYNLTDSDRFWSPIWNRSNLKNYTYHCFDTAWINSSLLVVCGSYSICEDYGFIRRSDTSSLEPALDLEKNNHKQKRPSIMNTKRRKTHKLIGQNIMKEFERLAKNMLNP